MATELMVAFLRKIGLTKKEIDMYFFLCSYKAITCDQITKRLRIHKAEGYRILKSLQSKGLVEATLESPTRFTTTPVTKTINLFIDEKEREIKQAMTLRSFMETEKTKVEYVPLESFLVIKGQEKIDRLIIRSLKEAKNNVLSLLQLKVIKLLLQDEFKNNSVSAMRILVCNSSDHPLIDTFRNKSNVSIRYVNPTLDISIIVIDNEKLLLIFSSNSDSAFYVKMDTVVTFVS
ncbi:MAG: hypothetical protein NWE95_09400 [Candidatus Bathyarchaeota archaeon]|nr:hypothetical protein [Candidatus Bathyarchaeota archaeon]